ncbi:MAG: OmpA family protein [Rhodospirillales bacterium]|nr:OmpA family protein [Rhodospirillales bacterium]
MKKTAKIITVLLALVLASCSGNLADIKLPSFTLFDETPRGFYANLANEYENLAAYELEVMNHPDDSAHFQAKARRVLRHQNVPPDDPQDFNIPDGIKKKMIDARVMLMDALETMQTSENEALLAMAQSRYDCWLVHQEDFPAKNAYISCKKDFYDALALLSMPVDDHTIYSIYFDSAAVGLSDDGKETVSKVAEHYRDRAEWVLILKGYTDTEGSASENKVLSMRRAIAVKHALAQYGISLDNIVISAEGESRKAQGAEGRRVDIEAAPGYMAKDKKGQRVAPGWQHSAEF